MYGKSESNTCSNRAPIPDKPKGHTRKGNSVSSDLKIVYLVVLEKNH